METNLILIRQSDTVNVRQEQISCSVMGNTNTKNSFRSNIAPYVKTRHKNHNHAYVYLKT